jgi:hypothetical protein
MHDRKIRIIAFYLPQYHPIPENDEWWGKGFTEWTNVARSVPLYKGHDQPKLPADLGFYDLRVPETRQAQADLASEYGIEGFAYWHYWFAGRKLLERPFDEVLESGKPDFPFCLAWANHTWSGIWIGKTDKILIEQTYPGVNDHTAHFYEVLKAFRDPRYIKVENKPLFYLFNPSEIPDLSSFIKLWNDLAKQNGLDGIFFTGPVPYPDKNGSQLINMGFNAVHSYRFEESFSKMDGFSLMERIVRKFQRTFKLNPRVNLNIYDYREFIKHMSANGDKSDLFFPTLYPDFDNSPRSGERALIMEHASPEEFRKHVKDVLLKVADKPYERRVIILKSWNEWAEGNFMEPDIKYGHGYLEVLKSEIENSFR